MNSQSECKYSIHLVVGGPGRSRYRCRWRGTAFVAYNAIPVGRRFRVRPILREAESLVARTPDVWAIDQELASRRQHRPQSKEDGDHCHLGDTVDNVVARCAVVDRGLSDSRLGCVGHFYPDPPVAD